MKHAIRSKLLMAAGVALVLVGGASLFVYANAAQAAQTADTQTTARLILGASDCLLADLTEAYGQRCSYLLTPGETSRRLYREALAAMRDRLDELRGLTGDTEQQGRLDDIEPKVAALHDLLEESLQARDDPKRRFDDQRQVALSQRLKEEEASIRGLLQQVKDAEQNRLARSGAAVQATAGRTMVIVDICNVLILVLALLAIVVLRQDFLAWDRADVTVRAACTKAQNQAAGADAALKVKTAQQEQMGEQCRRLEQLSTVGRLTTGVAHDFNNLLAVMMGGCEATLHVLPADALLREPLDAALKACEIASALNRRLLSLARKRPSQPAPLDLNLVVSDMERILRGLVGDDLTLEMNLTPGLRLSMADVVQVEQILLNLVVNARDASTPGGRIRVSTCNREGRVELAVTDAGCGMDEPTRARMFEPFFTTKAEGKGTGLGLAMVLEAVQENAGRIDVDSTPGHGTTVRVSLPVAAGTHAATILLVDPAGKVLSALVDTLQRFGHTVLTATDGEDALRQAAAHGGSIHVLMTEMAPPGICGPELAARLSVMHPGIKVLYLAGETGATKFRTDAGGVAFLPRPYTLELLSSVLREAVGDLAAR